MPQLIAPALLGWVLVTAVLFWLMRPRRALLVSLIVGYAYLPTVSIDLFGWPGGFGKGTAIVVGSLFGVALFDLGRLTTFRLRWIDVPILVFCLAPFFTSLANELGVRDGLSEIFRQLLGFGAPWFLGRLYFRDLEALRDLAWAIAVGGLLCAPLALWEVRMSPQLHRTVYGVEAIQFRAFHRYGGYRPIAFMASPLMLGMWMSTATVCCFWLLTSRSGGRQARPFLAAALPVLVISTILGKTFGAATLMVAGSGLLWFCSRFSTRVPLWLVVVAAFAYPVGRPLGIVPAAPIVAMAEGIYPSQRVASLRFRLMNEDLLMARALERPWLGWGAWGRSRVVEGMSKADVVTDGLWVTVFGKQGLMGLLGLAGSMLLPALGILRIPASRWRSREFAPAAALAMIVTLYWIDSLLNAFITPVTIATMGAGSGLLLRSGSRMRSRPPHTLPRSSAAKSAP